MYGGLTPKRHIAYSNSRTVANFNLGTLVKRAREALSKHAYKSSKTYKSKSSGKKSFCGSRFLKQTQRHGFNLDNVFFYAPCLRIALGCLIVHSFWDNSTGHTKEGLPYPSFPMHLPSSTSFSDLCSHCLRPRTYPPRFGLRVAKYHTRFCAQREAFRPELVDMTTPLPKLFSLLQWEPVDIWEDAGLLDLFCYLRGSKSLDLGEWKPLFPTTIPILNWSWEGSFHIWTTSKQRELPSNSIIGE